ncbi:MAG TPA: acyl-CoA dehydrogenase family protein, partial [Candidatus Dormibacteraeota bacterium]|nr:acyl-CoA dehydrogenase family protein [Candidatus Dormibacteraeota bacterium]
MRRHAPVVHQRRYVGGQRRRSRDSVSFPEPTQPARLPHREDALTYRLTQEHDELRAVVRELADERIAPRAAEIDATAEFPWDLKELLAKQDLL